MLRLNTEKTTLFDLTRSRLNVAPILGRIRELLLVCGFHVAVYPILTCLRARFMRGLLRTHSLADSDSLFGTTKIDDENVDDAREIQLPCVTPDFLPRIIFVHSYMYCNLLKHKLMSIVDRHF